ncbi:beta-galactosidase [Chthonomonas calidirosea]|uniref:Beta-galactosidase n=1 Tax=Chthonomonas calidirosea (strain DSM 23976 / ICMP 18418 / T49) TaxID=1303518 RepID=S0EYZ8_CHTCT|nr:beta-galactosidase [Chthonomonas calidirosea]CCW35847.1 Beta-galactosidase [Chthonomonas calidirosea T49]CEK19069.1 beta-galactosidase [Chthonomonas calidirosea]
MKLYLLLLILATAAALCARAQESPETTFSGFTLRPNNADIAIENAPEHPTLRITFHKGAEWPQVLFKPASPLDWSGVEALSFTLSNPGKRPVAFGFRIDDSLDADGYNHSRTANGSIAPGQTQTFAVRFGPDPMSLGMRGLPPIPGMVTLGVSGGNPFSFQHVVQFQLFLHSPDQNVTLALSSFKTLPLSTEDLKGVVDAYGQYAKADWPGKVHSDADLVQQRREEEADLKAHPPLPDRDPYGGWARGPQLKATGYFRTEKYDGKWMLVTPSGHLFFSLGLDVVESNYPTFITGRESLFASLPDPNGPLGAFYGESGAYMGPLAGKRGKTFDFYRANLYRKYGPNYQTEWQQMALKRLPSWGFNTIGNWSDPIFYQNQQVPFVATGGVYGDFATVSSGSDYWGRMPDPFDPRFAAAADANMKNLAARVRNSPWCVGYFIDNELSWAGSGPDGDVGLALGALKEEASKSPAKRAFLHQLQEKYGDIARFNAAWHADVSSWQQLEAPYKASLPLTQEAHQDAERFVRAFADKYFQTIREALKRYDPNHLYLGCRFAWHSRAEVEEAAKYCDVVSFNIYAPRVDANQWGYLADLNRPCIIGEFHFGALDRGMWHPGLVSAPNQETRAQMFIDYVHSVLDNPAFVGCHWFQYVDEPLTGRTWDGENYNIGFVTQTDRPYRHMVAAARRVGAELYTYRFGASHAAAK